VHSITTLDGILHIYKAKLTQVIMSSGTSGEIFAAGDNVYPLISTADATPPVLPLRVALIHPLANVRAKKLTTLMGLRYGLCLDRRIQP
jgi:hypothetical protein